jgi:hypothetical protein
MLAKSAKTNAKSAKNDYRNMLPGHLVKKPWRSWRSLGALGEYFVLHVPKQG